MVLGAKSGSIFDVLYADVRRLSSLLSQFSSDGLTVEVSRTVNDSVTTGAELNLKVIKTGQSENAGEAATQRIDPQWLLPHMFLDAAADIVHRDITQAAIGSLVLVTGRLIVTDLGVLRELWNAPALKKAMIDGAMGTDEQSPGTGGAARQAHKAARTEQRRNIEMMFELLPLMPHSPQLNIVTEEYAVWSTINEASLVGTVSDILLKHGAKVAGSWSVVGILDGRPFEAQDDDDADYDDILSAVERAKMGMFSDNVWKIATELGGTIREALGRPTTSYSVTPLVIFREIER